MILGYVAISALLLIFLLYSSFSSKLKTLVVFIMASFYVFTWMGYKQILGWPSTQVIPDEFRLVWVSIDEPDKFIDNGVSYAVRSIEKYDKKNVMIFGGGDSALDWTVELSKNAKSVTLIHRRDAFRGAQHTEEMMRELVKKNKVKHESKSEVNKHFLK